MPGYLKWGASHREPAELAGSETKPGVSIRLHRQCPGIAALLAHFRDAVWPAEHEKGLYDADVNQQDNPEVCKEDPQRPLPWICQVEAPTDHMCHTCPDREDREHDVGDVPCLVPDVQLHPPQGHHDQRDQRVRRQGGKACAPRRCEGVEQHEPFRLDDKQNDRVRHHQTNRDERHLAVKVVDDVFAPRFGDEAEARCETELQTHHRQARVADGGRELCPEIAGGRVRSRKERKQRPEYKEQIECRPNGATHDKARLHCYPLVQKSCNSAAVSPLMLDSSSFCLESQWFSEIVCMLLLGGVVEKITSAKQSERPRDRPRPYLGGQLPLISGHRC